ncbi:MAG: hypothetical protein ACFFCW_08525 [Candidatus Hodarchaeota archaeon]
MWEEQLEHSKRIHALHDLLQELENSRNKISETEYASRTVPLQKTMPPREFVVLWATHSTLFKRFCLFLQTYLENFQARDNQGNTDDLTDLMSRYVEGCQPSSTRRVRELRALSTMSNTRLLVLQLSILACQQAHAIHKNNRTDASRKTVVVRAAESQLAAREAHVLPPRQVVRLVEQLARELAFEEQNASEKEIATLEATLAMIEFTKKLGQRGGVVGREQEKESPPPKKQKQEKKKTWVEFKAVWDETGDPVPNVRLRIANPDGMENFHTTNSKGMIRIDGIDPGDCEARSDLNNPLLSNTLNFGKMGEPSGSGSGEDAKQQPQATQSEAPKRTGVQQIAVIEEHKVKTGESIKSLAEEADLTWQKLAKFNWDTDVPKEINDHLRDDVGCTVKTPDGNNYKFDDSDDPGIIYIPNKWEKMGLTTEKTHIIQVSCLRGPTKFAVLIPLDDIFIDAVDDDEAILESADGAYKKTLRVTEAGQKIDEEYIQLTFPNVIPGKKYTLTYDTKEDADGYEVSKVVMLSRKLGIEQLEKPLKLDVPFDDYEDTDTTMS